MKKLAVLFSAIVMLAVTNANASVEKYSINDDAVEAVLNEGVVVNSVFDLNELAGVTAPQAVLSDKNAAVAAILAFVIGWTGIHRVYLGGRPVLVLFYIITFGGIFGIVPFIDFIVLLINLDDPSQYIGNDKFIMW